MHQIYSSKIRFIKDNIAYNLTALRLNINFVVM